MAMTKEEALAVLRDFGGEGTAADFLSSVLSPEEVEAAKVAQEEANEQRIADAQIFFDVFMTGRGPELLEILRHKTVYLSTMDRDNCVIDGNIPLNPGELMAGREMQNALIRFIERQIRIAQEKVA